MQISPWSNNPKIKCLSHHQVTWPDEFKSLLTHIKTDYLPVSFRKSYSDICLNSKSIINMQSFNKMLSFDQKQGLVHCQSGMELAELLKIIVPKGYFIPCSPGTKYLSLGGMCANDVHGKDYYQQGSFGHHILELTLLKSDGELVKCSLNKNSEIFKATIGGLGLTGIILDLKIQCIPTQSAKLSVQILKFSNLKEYLELVKEYDDKFEYSVSWINTNQFNFQGYFMGGNFLKDQDMNLELKKPLDIPLPAKIRLLNESFIRLGNFLNDTKLSIGKKHQIQDIDSFFYPLDGIQNWNMAYGKTGFFQYQFVLPKEEEAQVQEIFNLMKKYQQRSFISVVKYFDSIKPIGMLSFPLEGLSMALDFINHGEKTFKMFNEFNQVVIKSGGRIYLAKNTQVTPKQMHSFYPQFDEFKQYMDPNICSEFSRRMMK